MPGDACVVCENTRKKAPQLSYHRFPSDRVRRALWLQTFQLAEEQVGTFKPRQRSHHRSCGIVWRSIGSLRSAPGMSDSVSSTAAAWLLLGTSLSHIATIAVVLHTRSSNLSRSRFQQRGMNSSFSWHSPKQHKRYS